VDKIVISTDSGIILAFIFCTQFYGNVLDVKDVSESYEFIEESIKKIARIYPRILDYRWQIRK